MILFSSLLQLMASKHEHLASGRCSRQSSAVPVPSTSTTEREMDSLCSLWLRLELFLVWSYSASDWLPQALSHHAVDVCAGLGSLPVRSLHLQNCTADDRGYGTSNCGKWVKEKVRWGVELQNNPRALRQVLLEHVHQVLSAPVLGFSILGMLIGFQCFPESEEEVGARQKKRNWKRSTRFPSGALNSCPLWPPE